MVSGFVVFTIVFHLVVKQKVVGVGLMAFKPHSFALFCASVFSFILGFILNKYVVFTASNLRGRIQFFSLFFSIPFQFLHQLFFIERPGIVPACVPCTGAGNCDCHCGHHQFFYAAVLYL